MWLIKGTSSWHCRYASCACLSLRHLSHLVTWCFSESCFSQFKDAQVRRHFWNQGRQWILSLLCSECQSTELWSALCKRSDDYLKNLKTSLSWLLNSNPGLFLGQHHSPGSTSLTQCISTPGRRKVPAPSVPAQALPSMGWVNHSILHPRTGRLFWAQLCICTMRTLLAWAKPDVQPTTQATRSGDIHTHQQSQKTVMLHNWSKHKTGLRYNHLWLLTALHSLGHEIQGMQSQQ